MPAQQPCCKLTVWPVRGSPEEGRQDGTSHVSETSRQHGTGCRSSGDDPDHPSGRCTPATTTVPPGTSRVTTAPAATTATAPMLAPYVTAEAAPTHTSSSLTIRALAGRDARSAKGRGALPVIRFTFGPLSVRIGPGVGEVACGEPAMPKVLGERQHRGPSPTRCERGPAPNRTAETPPNNGHSLQLTVADPPAYRSLEPHRTTAAPLTTRTPVPILLTACRGGQAATGVTNR